MATLRNRFFIEGIILGACVVWFSVYSSPFKLAASACNEARKLVDRVVRHQQPSVDYTWLRQ